MIQKPEKLIPRSQSASRKTALNSDGGSGWMTPGSTGISGSRPFGPRPAEHPTPERNKRNNVEASIWHLTHTLRKDKTSYRGLIKNKLWAWCRALWVKYEAHSTIFGSTGRIRRRKPAIYPKSVQIT